MTTPQPHTHILPSASIHSTHGDSTTVLLYILHRLHCSQTNTPFLPHCLKGRHLQWVGPPRAASLYLYCPGRARSSCPTPKPFPLRAHTLALHNSSPGPHTTASATPSGQAQTSPPQTRHLFSPSHFCPYYHYNNDHQVTDLTLDQFYIVFSPHQSTSPMETTARLSIPGWKL